MPIDIQLSIYQRAHILARELHRLDDDPAMNIINPRPLAVAEGVLAENPLDEGIELTASDAGLVADILEEELVDIDAGERTLRRPNIVGRLENIISVLRREA